MIKSINHTSNQNHFSDHLTILRTASSLSNTFLSLLRTVVVLTGVAALLIRHHKAIWFNRIFIIILIILVFISSWQFYNDSMQLINLDKNALLNPKWHWRTPLLFSGLLIILLVMLLIIGS